MSGLRWTIGSASVTRVLEQDAGFPAEAFFPPATPEVLARHAPWLAPWALADDGRLLIAIQAICIEADGQRIVVDTCIGQRPLPEPYTPLSDDGSFLTALATAGFARETVDTVICTHLHFDHVGWNTMWVDDAWVPTFPNARYLLARSEYDHWRGVTAEARAAASALTFDDAVEPLFAHGVVDLVEPDHVVAASVRLVPTPGHSPGHVSVRIDSDGAAAIVTGDCVHSPVQLAETDWYTAVDADGERSSATRRALVEECADRDVLLVGTHFPPPTAGYVVTTPEGVRFRPAG